MSEPLDAPRDALTPSAQNSSLGTPQPLAQASVPAGKKKRKRAFRSVAARAASREGSIEMWKDIEKGRTEYVALIDSLSEKHNRPRNFIAAQMYGGGRLLTGKRALSDYQVFISDQANMLKENGTPLAGVAGMPVLSAQISKDKEWQTLDSEEKAWMRKGVMERKDAKNSEHTPIRASAIIESFSSRLDAEIATVGSNTARANASPQVKEAFQLLFKQSLDSIVLKVEAFLVAGLSGALRLGSGDKADKAKKEIRRQINEGLGEVLIRDRGYTEDTIPYAMNYANYEKAIVVKYGVHLAGWTHDKFENPGNIKTGTALNALLSALALGTCYWQTLSAEEWGARKLAYAALEAAGAARKRKIRSDAGKSKHPHRTSTGKRINVSKDVRPPKKQQKTAKSARIIRDSEDDDDEEEEEGEEGEEDAAISNEEEDSGDDEDGDSDE
ncbi:hypothetical protein HWV62_9859 [Athelia sp. TMB]|nr:hypothetical protein HWV62_9859 [Athelia sp. TMB]